ncbi:MAG: c-type cytochrome [Gemmatimonadetes bacterium]|nr:c-type cytochrome [Gemmatimonadota bacterium]
MGWSRAPLALFLPGVVFWLLFANVGSLKGQLPADVDTLSDAALFDAACANCHGSDGRGLDRALLGFEEPLPDFTDCNFAARERSADWVAVAHGGGPARGFSRMMPAFGEALSKSQLQRVIAYVHSLCSEPAWPRGELNLPRPLLTEKAFPEDEWVVESDAAIEGDGSVSGAFVYERRFGRRAQLEVVIPYGWVEVPVAAAPNATKWVSGFGDVVLGAKYAVHHSFSAGRIFSLGGEVALPTGDESKGIGAAGTKLEGFMSFGQILPVGAFVQAQAGAEFPLYTGGENEGFGRIALGRTFTSGGFGRTWTPMVELQGKREIAGSVPIALDVVPQMQVSLSTRQHVLFNVGLLVPATETSGRSVRLMAYLLLDWFDGGFFEGW